MPHNILFLDHGGKLIGGGHFSTLLLLKHLDRSRFTPILATSKESLFTEKARANGVRVEILSLDSTLTSVYRNKVSRNPIFLIRALYFLIQAVVRVKRFIKEEDIHMIHPGDNLSRVVGGIAAKIEGIPAVCHARDELDARRLVDRILKYAYLLTMDRVIAVSDRIREVFRYRNRIPTKVITVYNGIDLSVYDIEKVRSAGIRKQYSIGSKRVVIALVGLLIPLKGHIFLFHALQRLKEEGCANITCLLVGDGPEKEHLKSEVRERALEKDVFFLGFRDDIPNVLKEVDILVLPSLTEAFPRVVIEGMAMGLPVIGTSVGGIPEAIVHGKTGLIVPPRDPEALYDALRTLVTSPDLRTRFGVEGRKRVETLFDNELSVRKVEDIYTTLLPRQGESAIEDPITQPTL